MSSENNKPRKREGASRPPAPRPPTGTAADARPSSPQSAAAPQTQSPHPTPAARPARPAEPTRPATPGPRLEGVMFEATAESQSIETIVPSGLSTSTYLPSSKLNPDRLRLLAQQRQLRFRETILPSLIVLCVSLVLMGAGWFLLDPFSALRDNALGKTIPMSLFALGGCFGILGAIVSMQASRLRAAIDAAAVV